MTRFHVRCRTATVLLMMLAGAAPGEPPEQRWTAPRSYRLAEFAEDLYNPDGQKVLAVIGDSINATSSTHGMQTGYRDRLEIPFNGWVVHADSGNSDIGYMNAQGPLASNAMRIPGDTFSSGVSAISPVRTRDAVWNGNVAFGGTLSDCFIINSKLAEMKLGNPFASSATVDARLIMYEGATQVAGFDAAGVRGSTNTSTGEYDRPPSVAGAIVWLDRAAGAGTASPGLRLRSDSTTAESTSGANTLMMLGARFRAQIEDGVQVQFIAHGGWTSVDHGSTSRFTDEALRQYYAATDPPTHAILWIGQNQTSQESANFYTNSYALYKSHVEAIIDRHEAAIAELESSPPQWLLVSQYKTGYDEFHHELISAGLHAISQERENVSFLNLYRIAGGELFNQSAYLSDGVHPSPGGVAYLASLMNAEMKSSIMCLADFDGSGFVDIDDYDDFVVAFELGDEACDINSTGFVDLDDFDFFVLLFEGGC